MANKKRDLTKTIVGAVGVAIAGAGAVLAAKTIVDKNRKKTKPAGKSVSKKSALKKSKKK